MAEDAGDASHSPTCLHDLSPCGSAVSSFLTIHQRGRLLQVDRQMRTDSWGIRKDKTYGGSSGMSASEATDLILRVATSEFSPDRLSEDAYQLTDAFLWLRLDGKGAACDDTSMLADILAELFLEQRILRGSWFSAKDGRYDLDKVEWELPGSCDDQDEDYFGFPDGKSFLRNILGQFNDLLSKLRNARDHLRSLPNDAPAPDLYQYLVNDAGVPPSYLDRFGENRISSWGKAGADMDNEPLAYWTRNSAGMIAINGIGPLFPPTVTVCAIPSKGYNPKPLHLRKCVKCMAIRHDISDYECPFKWCSEEHKGKCADCVPKLTCSTCNRSGCSCRFEACSVAGCSAKMCNCTNFHGWKHDDSGGARGCSYFLPPEMTEDMDEEEYAKLSWKAEEKKYCKNHKPDGAEPYY